MAVTTYLYHHMHVWEFMSRMSLHACVSGDEEDQAVGRLATLPT